MKSKITQEELKLRFTYYPEEGVFRRNKSMKIFGSKRTDGRITMIIDGVNYMSHRLAWFYIHGYWPIEIDHIDRNHGNNKISNLREATRSQNCWNAGLGVRNKSGVKGLSWDKLNNKWLAQVCTFGKTSTLGRFLKKEDAIIALERHRKLNHKNFACHKGEILFKRKTTKLTK